MCGRHGLRRAAPSERKAACGLPRPPRVIHAPLKIDGIAGNYQVTGAQIRSRIPDFAQNLVSERLELRYGVGSLEALPSRRTSSYSRRARAIW